MQHHIERNPGNGTERDLFHTYYTGEISENFGVIRYAMSCLHSAANLVSLLRLLCLQGGTMYQKPKDTTLQETLCTSKTTATFL